MSSPYRLVMRTGPRAGEPISLEKEEIFIGRDVANDIVAEDPEVSRRHARLAFQGAGYVIEDLGSTNGTSVNGQRLMNPYVLRPGDVITLGEHTHLVFEAVNDTAASPSGPYAAVYPAGPEPSTRPPFAGAAPPPYQSPGAAPQPPYWQTPPYPYPASEAAEAQAARRPVSTTVIILAVVIVCLLLPCLIFAVIDLLNLYCTLFPGIVNMFVEGYCP